jgi:uncharacterized protein YbaP (TraB family)
MRRLIIVVFLSLFCLAASAADRGALFKVSAGGHSMYLFGTMHAGLPEFYPLEPRIANAVAESATLALEIDPAIDPAAAASAMQKYAMARAGSVAPPALAKRLQRLLKKDGIDPASVAPLKPWMIATILVMHEFSRLGYRVDLAVDSELAKMARAGKAKVVSLESLDSQMALFDSLSEKEQWRFLANTVELIESGKSGAEARQLAAAWSQADQPALDALARSVETDNTVSGRFMREVLLDGRNGALADKLQLLLAKEDKAVAAIGVLHLLGKRGVPELLRARGIDVERVY